MAAENRGAHVLCFIISLGACADVSLSTESARESHLLLRRDTEAEQSHQGRPTHLHGRRVDEAREAIDGPRIQEASWSARMPGFIERHPFYYASFFVLSGLAVLVGVCMHVHLEDRRDERKRLQRSAGHAQRRIPERPAPPPHSTLAEEKLPLMKRPKSPAGSEGLISNAVGNLAGLFAGASEPPPPPHLPKFSGWRSQESTSASGDLTPRSNAPSVSSSSDTLRHPPMSVIRSGTVLRTRIAEVVFASPTSWREIGKIPAGQEVVAAGAPEMVDDYTMVPIRPRGAIDLKVLEVVRDRLDE